MSTFQPTLKKCSALLIFGASVFMLFASLPAQVPTQVLVAPHFAVGEGWQTDVTVVAQGSQRSRGEVTFFGQDGAPLEVSVDGSPPTSRVEYLLEPGASITYELSSPADLRIGFVVVEGDFEGSDRGAIGGLVTFRFVQDGNVLSQVGVPPADYFRQGVVVFDNTGGNRTAVAVAANAFLPSSIRFDLFSEEGVFVESQVVEFAANTQSALFIDELFPGTAGTRGLVWAQATEVFNWLALNLRGLLLSSAEPLPEVLERDLQLVPEVGDPSDWKLRLIRQTTTLSGIADRLQPTPTNEFIVSGTLLEGDFYGTGRGSLNVNISTRDQDDAFVIALFGRFEDHTLTTEIEGIYIFYDEEGVILERGTFNLTSPE